MLFGCIFCDMFLVIVILSSIFQFSMIFTRILSLISVMKIYKKIHTGANPCPCKPMSLLALVDCLKQLICTQDGEARVPNWAAVHFLWLLAKNTQELSRANFRIKPLIIATITQNVNGCEKFFVCRTLTLIFSPLLIILQSIKKGGVGLHTVSFLIHIKS